MIDQILTDLSKSLMLNEALNIAEELVHVEDDFEKEKIEKNEVNQKVGCDVVDDIERIVEYELGDRFERLLSQQIIETNLVRSVNKKQVLFFTI